MFRTQRRIEFRDTDAAGIVHFSVFFPMMEVAEHDLIRSLGLSVLPDRGADPSEETLTWPRVAATCDYQSVARFEDLLEIDVAILNLGRSSVQYRFQFWQSSDRPEDRIAVARGTLTTVCCELHTGGVLKKTPIPETVRKLLSKHLDR
ncbi:acyl-CoA thioesterase [Novipirellula artificiosorum]|uniref:Acyl-CoA thioesterase YbgC n=1 Tax=Novipirellula artificiosorum TaxID=2528016 RepID=A0A5C6DBX7_9BACT|nr:thioesterase family protein [Novipirellula artificiosorum]TWU33705.1 acyl-CoA thioesterase YbgC [Novipirellula artificiosorum]